MEILKHTIHGFNAVQNNTSLKLSRLSDSTRACFNAVQNNTSLKHRLSSLGLLNRFNAVQNNTSLKLFSLS